MMQRPKPKDLMPTTSAVDCCLCCIVLCCLALMQSGLVSLTAARWSCPSTLDVAAPPCYLTRCCSIDNAMLPLAVVQPGLIEQELSLLVRPKHNQTCLHFPLTDVCCSMPCCFFAVFFAALQSRPIEQLFATAQHAGQAKVLPLT